MDYGKLAYVKAEELERWLRAQNSADERRKSSSAAFFPRVALQSGYAPCLLYGKGNTALTVALVLRAPKGVAEVKVRLYCGESLVAYTSVTLAAEQSARVVLPATVYPSDGEQLYVIASDGGLLLEEMHVLAQGNDVFVTSGRENIRSDCYGGEVFFAQEEGGYLMLKKYGLQEKVNVAHGSTFDIAASDEGIDVLCCDDDGNLWGVCYGADLEEKARVRLGDAPDKVALGRFAGGRLLAAIRNRKLYFAYADENFAGMTEWIPADFEAEADEVYLSRGAENSVLLLRRDDVLYAKLPAYNRTVRNTVTMAVSMTVAE